MGRAGLPFVVCCCCVVPAFVSTAAAQDVSSPPSHVQPADFEYVALTEEQDQELGKWFSGMEKWRRYDEKWRNRPVRNGWGGIGERKSPPAPPDWLDARCRTAAAAGLMELESRTKTACMLLEDPRAVIGTIPSAVHAAEAPRKHSSFLTRLHLDGGWTTSSTGQRLYGVIGTHFSLVDVGRVQVFGPPGVILLSVPDAGGGRRTTIGYTWGISVRLVDVRVGAPTKNLTLFVNVSKVWASGVSSSPAGSSRGFDLVGFSVAPRKGSK